MILVDAASLLISGHQILPHLDERHHRLYLASEATTLGHGGFTVVAAASDTSTAPIARDISELTATPTPTERVRAPGAGRNRWWRPTPACCRRWRH